VGQFFFPTTTRENCRSTIIKINLSKLHAIRSDLMRSLVGGGSGWSKPTGYHKVNPHPRWLATGRGKDHSGQEQDLAEVRRAALIMDIPVLATVRGSHK
jgi:hypothetical protein